MNSEDLQKLSYSQSEGYVEYSADGRVLKARRRVYEKSKYEEDELLGDHSSVWGSYFDVSTSRWGFQCCKQCVKTYSCIPCHQHPQSKKDLDDTKEEMPKHVLQDREGPQVLVKGMQVIKVQQVMQRFKGRDQCLKDLMASVSLLGSSCFNSAQLLKEKLDKIEFQQRVARNLGEDLVEDTLALDSLGNLSAADRSTRKDALANLEMLADKVDRVKASLQQLRHECEQAHGQIGSMKEMHQPKKDKKEKTKRKKKDRKKKHKKAKPVRKTKKAKRESSSSSSSTPS